MPLENSQVLGFPLQVLGSTCTAKVCKIMAFMAIIGGLGLLSYILLEFRYRKHEAKLRR